MNYKKPTLVDVFILSLFTAFITFHPFYTRQEINLFELGLYLPGINAIFHGQVPFRDFFHLRGPLELYVPAFLMSVFGKHICVLNTYFYVGTILTLIICVLIAAQLYRTRLIFYLMVPVLVARTFPRVVFAIWGGMRFAFGLLALLFIIRFIQREKPVWLFLAGITTALGIFTSVEIGACSFISLGVVMFCSLIFKVHERKLIVKSVLAYLAGIFVVAGPLCFYLSSQQALIPYWDSAYAVVTNMQNVIDPHFVSEYPRNIKEALGAMTNPNSQNFRHMTPSYLYIFLLIYLGWKIKNKKFDRTDLAVVGLGTYGFILYNTGFRGIWAAQFEMALQPEKILWFFVLELGFLFLMGKKSRLLKSVKPRHSEERSDEESQQREILRFAQNDGKAPFLNNSQKNILINFLCFALIASSLGYAIARYQHRFFVFRYLEHVVRGKNTDDLKPLAGRVVRPLKIERAERIIVPVEQAQEIEEIVRFVQRSTSPNQKVLLYPDQGIYHFFFDRPFVGRFPIPLFSWFNDRWHEEFIAELKNDKPKFIIVPQKNSAGWEAVHLALLENRKKYRAVMDIIDSGYILEKTTPFSYIYKRR